MEMMLAVGAFVLILFLLIIFVSKQKKRVSGGLQEFADRTGLSFNQVNKVERRVTGTREGRDIEFHTSIPDRKVPMLWEHWKVGIRGCPKTLHCSPKAYIKQLDKSGTPRITIGDPSFDDHVAALDETNPDAARAWLAAHAGAVRAVVEGRDRYIEEGTLRFDKEGLDTKPDKLVARLEELERVAATLETQVTA